jgi:hypothetical protein
MMNINNGIVGGLMAAATVDTSVMSGGLSMAVTSAPPVEAPNSAGKNRIFLLTISMYRTV